MILARENIDESTSTEHEFVNKDVLLNNNNWNTWTSGSCNRSHLAEPRLQFTNLDMVELGAFVLNNTNEAFVVR